jgi:hypothetical protein
MSSPIEDGRLRCPWSIKEAVWLELKCKCRFQSSSDVGQSQEFLSARYLRRYLLDQEDDNKKTPTVLSRTDRGLGNQNSLP